jgi:hypothetical protein
MVGAVAAKNVELAGCGYRLVLSTSFWGRRGSHGTNRRTASHCFSNGGSGCPHHRAGSGSFFAACSGNCRPTFAREVSRGFRELSASSGVRLFEFPRTARPEIQHTVGAEPNASTRSFLYASLILSRSVIVVSYDKGSGPRVLSHT